MAERAVVTEEGWLHVFRPHRHHWAPSDRTVRTTGAPIYACSGCDAEALDMSDPANRPREVEDDRG